MLWCGASNVTGQIFAGNESCSFLALSDRAHQQKEQLLQQLAAYPAQKHRLLLMASPTLGFLARLLACFYADVLPCVVSQEQIADFELCQQWHAAGFWEAGQLSLVSPDRYMSGKPFCTPEDAGLVLFTSGSSGLPKGVVLGKQGILAHLEAVAQHLEMGVKASVLVTLPLHHAFALITQVLLTLKTGGDLHLLPRQTLPGELCEYMNAHKIEHMAGVPSQWRALLFQSAEPVEHVKHIQVAGASLDKDTADKMLQSFPAADIWVGYGLTEAGPRVTAKKYGKHDENMGVGTPLPHVELKMLEQVLYVKSPAIMLGYLDNPEGTRQVLQNGWLRTGDCGELTSEGLKIKGREDTLFQSGGEKIAPLAIEHTLRQHESVLDVAVWGESDALLGQKIVAGIVCKTKVTKGELRQYARQHLKSFQVPREWRYFETLPMTANGKLQRQRLTQWPFLSETP